MSDQQKTVKLSSLPNYEILVDESGICLQKAAIVRSGFRNGNVAITSKKWYTTDAKTFEKVAPVEIDVQTD